jgi:hypothetical protein
MGIAEVGAGLQGFRSVETGGDICAVGRIQEVVAGEWAVDQPVPACQCR